MSFVRSKQFSDLIKGAFETVGLAGAFVWPDPSGSYVLQGPDGSLTADVVIRLNFDPQKMHSESGAVDEMVRLMTPIRESILNSPFVSGLKYEADRLRSRVEELEKYKTHFDAEFVLRHGKPAEGIQL